MFNQQSPFIQKSPSVTSIMMTVLLALIPGLIAYIIFYGVGILLNVLLAIITGLIAESTILKIRKLPVRLFITDGSAIVASCLLALSIPTITPWWIIVVGTLFTIVIAKHFYGGLGSNLFNPAMVGYAILLISFPAIMTKWQLPIHLIDGGLSPYQSSKIFFSGMQELTDSLATATPLDYIKTELFLGRNIIDANRNSQAILLASSAPTFIALSYFIGGVYLWIKKIITWHLPITYLVSITTISLIFHLIDPNQYSSPLFHLINGGTFLCAFFIITDPVSGPTTPNGKVIFAFGVALLVYLIRVFGGYPEGIAFAVILMNICVPLIDKFTQPKVFGHE